MSELQRHEKPHTTNLQKFDVEKIVALGQEDTAVQHTLINNYLALFESVLKNMADIPIYPDYQGLAKIKDYIGFAHNYVVDSQKYLKFAIAPEVQAELTKLLTQLLPGLSIIATAPVRKPGEAIPYGASLPGWEQSYQNDSYIALQKVTQFDRIGAEYVGSEIHGRNKLARIFVVFNPGTLHLISQKMNTEQRTTFINKVLAGDIPYSLITDQEIARVLAQQNWRKKHSESPESAGPEPPKSARTLFLTAIDAAISAGHDPNYDEINKHILTALPDPNPEYCHMVDITSDDYQASSDVPWNMWGETRPLF